MLSKAVAESLDMNTMIPKTIFALLALIVLIQPINQGYATAYQYVPSVNDGWVESLEYIKTNSTETAIINSWWDFGHWFKYWADRRVTFDGASQNSQNAHWIGKVLLTSEEEEAIAILRMLDCGGNNAEKELRKAMDGDSYNTVKLLYQLFKMEENDAKKELLKYTDEESATKILSYLYCKEPENYFITSEDMVGKSGVWAHFGIWNFERASIFNLFNIETYDKFISNMSKDYGYDTETSKRIYFEIKALESDRAVNDWIAPWPSYGGGVNCMTIDSERKQCNMPIQNNQVIPLVINFTDMSTYVDANGQKFHPNNFAYFDGEDFVIKEYEENKLGYGVVYIDNSVLFMSPELTGSMFTRLFYLDGKGIKRFNKVYGTTDVTGARIKTWKVKWEI
jgi:dolichyl-diphosphooligosaccharide--protein glycosyltransferase